MPFTENLFRVQSSRALESLTIGHVPRRTCPGGTRDVAELRRVGSRVGSAPACRCSIAPCTFGLRTKGRVVSGRKWFHGLLGCCAGSRSSGETSEDGEVEMLRCLVDHPGRFGTGQRKNHEASPGANTLRFLEAGHWGAGHWSWLFLTPQKVTKVWSLVEAIWGVNRCELRLVRRGDLQRYGPWLRSGQREPSTPRHSMGLP